MNRPLISIIIPVYNAQCYIRRCIESVLSQTYKDIQVILINDGSTDNTLSILEEYSRSDSRIQLINKDNSGVSKTRNIGIDISDGEYIGFVDEHGKYNSWYIGAEPQMRNLPKSWDYQLNGLKEIAKTLSNGFDFVRVDLYCYQKEFYFGEMTFTPCSGKLKCINL